MSTYTEKTYDANNYLKYRPVYPASLYERLRAYIGLGESEKVDTVLDLGCGSGQASLTLAKTVACKVFAVDNSEVMIKAGRQNAADAGVDDVDFIVGNDETLTSQFKKHSIDLLTVAEAAHWFSYPDFWEAAHYVLKPGGTLAIWSYYIPSIIGHPEAVKHIEDFSFNPQKCGGYWDPGQSQLNNLYADMALPTNLFENEERVVNDYLELRPEQPFELVRKEVPLDALFKLLETYSGYHNWKKANPGKKDILEETRDQVLSSTGLTPESKVTLKWNSVYIYAKAKPIEP